MITGRDQLSQEIIKDLTDKTIKIKDIPKRYDISLDQAKRLSRYLKITLAANKHLSASVNQKVNLMGLKVLALANLFKNEDWEGLEEILSSVNENTTRDQLKQMILSLEEKRKRIQKFLKETKLKIKYLEESRKDVKEKIEQLKSIQSEIKVLTKDFQKYDETTREFLLEHVGIYQRTSQGENEATNTLILIKRLDSLFQKKLKNMGVITYNDLKYTHEINDLDKFVRAYLERKKKRGGIIWDFEKEDRRAENKAYFAPSSPYYKKGVQLIGESLLQKIEQTQEDLKKIEGQIKETEEEIQDLRKISVKSFSEAIIASNMLSAKEIQKHGELQYKVGKWLYSKGYVVGFEVILPNGKRVDVAGFDENREIIFVEVKASDNDFQNDKKWKEYLLYCDKFYFFGDWEFRPHSKDDKTDAGFLLKYGNTIEVCSETAIEHSVKNRDTIIFSISRAISKKSVYGY